MLDFLAFLGSADENWQTRQLKKFIPQIGGMKLRQGGSYDPKTGRTPMAKRSYNPVTKAITPVEYGGLQKAYDFFKEHLLKERGLPDCFITYQRRANSAGYFAPDRFADRGEKFGGRHELALNPDGFIGRTDQEVLSTLVHEMVHVWQQHCGTPSKRGYHNKEWATKMKLVGLQPSSTGMVGGKETGQRMSHYVIPDGAFEQAYQELAASGWNLNLQSAHRPGSKGGVNSKTKYTTPAHSTCGVNLMLASSA
jgi:hypothetical protein